MTILAGCLLFAWTLAFAAYCCWDIHEECLFQTDAAEHEELLDELWNEDE